MRDGRKSIILGFAPLAPVPIETIDRYRDFVLPEVAQIWTEQGYGTGVDGFLKVIDPDVFRAHLGGIIPDNTVPFLATGMADLYMWDVMEGRGLIYRFRHGIFVSTGESMRIFSEYLRDEESLDEWCAVGAYREAVAMHGALEYDQCFAYVPLLALGGFQRPESLQKVELLTHIQVIHQMAVPIQYVR